MILRRLRVTGFRRHSDPVELIFDDRLTFVTGPNEVGKSTVFEAVRYALFRRSGAGAKDIEALKPWDKPNVAPRVELDFVADDGHMYRLIKTWGNKGTADFGVIQNGDVLPVNVGDIDSHVASLFSGSPPGKGAFSGFKATHQGLGYLLFAPQGKMELKTNDDVDGSIGPQAVGRLGELVGAGTVSLDDERVMRAVGKNVSEYYTPGGKLKKAAPSTGMQQKAASLAEELSAAQTERDRFEKVAKDLEELERLCLEREQEIEKARKERDERQPQMQQAVELKAKLDAAADGHSKANKHFAELHERLQTVDAEDAHIRELRRQRSTHESAVAELQVAENKARDARTDAQSEFSAAFVDDQSLVNDEARLNRAQQSAVSAEKLRATQELLREIESIQKEAREFAVRISAIPEITREQIENLSRFLNEQVRLQSDIRASSLRVELTAKQPIRIKTGRRKAELAAAQRFSHDAIGEITLSIEDVADIVVAGPVPDISKQELRLATVKQEIAAIAAVCGSRDPVEVERRRSERGALAANHQTCEKRLLDKLGAGGSVRQIQEAEASLKQAAEGAIPTDEVAALEHSVGNRKNATEQRRSAARTNLEAVSAQFEGAKQSCDLKRAEIAAIDDEIAKHEMERVRAIGDTRTREELARRESQAVADRAVAEQKLSDLQRAYEPYRDISDPTLELKRLVNRADELARLFNEDTNAREVKRTEFQALQSSGISTRIALLEERLEDTRRELAMAEREEAASMLLSDLVQEKTANRNRELAEPLLMTVAPWFERVSGHALTELTLTEDATASELRLRDVAVPIGWEDFSVGTADQLGVLLRLALAKELALKAPLPVLLDDPLAHCDPRRTLRLLDVIVEASQHTQVIVFTYDESMCAGLGKIAPLR
ncbi:MAG: AAA family ATPase [Vulcanimicrobiaceae bacterium]|jgi:energy-coupling factor transporter ATP-binding protein EcfA2